MIALQVSATNSIDWPTRLDAVTLPRPSEQCQGDLGVHKAIATLGATITTVTGVLSCFTAGYWGQVRTQLLGTARKFDPEKFSDRYGRTLVLAITVSGVLLTCVLALLADLTLSLYCRDLILILVAHFGQSLPFGYRFVLIASIVEGLLGGMSHPVPINSTYHNRVFQEYPLEGLLDMPISPIAPTPQPALDTSPSPWACSLLGLLLAPPLVVFSSPRPETY